MIDIGDYIKPVLIFLVISFALLYTGFCFGKMKVQNNAVKAKVAEYYLDENNSKQFRFKETGK